MHRRLARPRMSPRGRVTPRLTRRPSWRLPLRAWRPRLIFPAVRSIFASKILPNATHVVAFIGSGTEWLSNPPTFTPSGVDGVATVGDVTVVNDTVARQSVTYGDAVGVVTWTDVDDGLDPQPAGDAIPPLDGLQGSQEVRRHHGADSWPPSTLAPPSVDPTPRGS